MCWAACEGGLDVDGVGTRPHASGGRKAARAPRILTPKPMIAPTMLMPCIDLIAEVIVSIDIGKACP